MELYDKHFLYNLMHLQNQSEVGNIFFKIKGLNPTGGNSNLILQRVQKLRNGIVHETEFKLLNMTILFVYYILALPRVLIVTPTVYPRLVVNYDFRYFPYKS